MQGRERMENMMDDDMVNELLAEISQGYSLLADPTEGTFNVWVVYEDGGTSMAPYEGVTNDELRAVHMLHPDKVSHRYPLLDWPNGPPELSRD
jgi:hypothetical protein